jgi:hypothetical protein
LLVEFGSVVDAPPLPRASPLVLVDRLHRVRSRYRFDTTAYLWPAR